MKVNKYLIITIVILAAELAVVLWLGLTLPAGAKVPVHWNIRSEIDGWASPGAVMLPFWLFNAALFLLLSFSPRLFPVYKQNRERYDAVIPPLTLVLVLFFALIHVYMLLVAHHPRLEQKVQFIFILMGALFICLGNLLPRLPRNFIAGIRTPWTFYSDEIWRRTSRLGGYCFVMAGLVLALAGLLNLRGSWMSILLAAVFGTLLLVPVAYSFILYQKSRKEE